ncbi:CHAT domain-containing protein [Methylobacterium fujisawaense]
MTTQPIFAEIYDEGVANAFKSIGNPLGSIQIIFVAQGQWEDRVGPFLSWPLAMMNPETNKPVFNGLSVIAPPGSRSDEITAKLAGAITAHRARWSGRGLPDGEREALARRIEIIVAGGSTVQDIAPALASVKRQRAVAILSATSYSSAIAQSNGTDGWASAVTELAELGSECAAKNQQFVAIDTSLPRPAKLVSDRLRSIQACSLFCATAKGPEEHLAEILPEWRDVVREGGTSAVLRAIDVLSDVDNFDCDVLRIEVLNEAGRSDAALEMIRSLDPMTTMEPDQAARLSLIAANAGGIDTAIRILGRYLPEFETQTVMETALRAAQRAADDDIAVELEARLEEDHPTSALLTQAQYMRAVKRCDHQAAHEILAGKAGAEALARMHLELAEKLEVEGVPDYLAIVGSMAKDIQARGRVECARHALKLQLANRAVALLLSADSVAARTGTFELCDALDQILLRRGPNGTLSVDDDSVQEAFDTLAARLGDDAGNKLLRVRLLDLIEPAASGSLGKELLLTALRRRRRRPVKLIKHAEVTGSVTMADLLAIDGFKERFERWIGDDWPLHVGRSTFPRSDLPAGADQICRGILHEMASGVRRASPEDADGVLLTLAFGTAVAAHASTPNLDLPMIRVAAIGFALGGQEQQARDTVETMLEIAATPDRRRLAWLGMADVYSRANKNLEAALYAVAGLGQGDGEIDEQQYWHETLIAYRIQRELGNFADAEESLAAAERMLIAMGRADDYIHQIETNRIALELYKGRTGITSPEFSALLERMVINAQAVIDSADDVGPAATMLVQMIREGRKMGARVPANADAVAASLMEKLEGKLAERAEALGRDVPSACDLLLMIRQSSGQRYSSDVGTDVRALALTARRALSADETLRDTDTTCLALEMTFDRALAMPGWTDAKRPPTAPDGTNVVADALRQISALGTAVVLSGLAENGTLVRVDAVDGKVGQPLREDPNLFSRDLLDKWARDYPFHYGTEKRPANAFLTTTEQLRFSSLPAGPLLLIRDSRMASFPPNILRSGPVGSTSIEPFAGAERPVSSAPSVQWLEAAIQSTAQGDGRRLAWMPGGGTMKSIAELSSGPFEDHHVQLDNQERLPDHFRGASLAIIAAHGNLNPDGSAFQVVSSEGSVAVTAGELARALHNVRLVILFVCSGGRSDKHPAADATIGLAREILDQGTQAVVASPWPLESLVPPRWITTFLNRWDKGDTLADAVHAANRNLFDRDQNPEKGLAMNVFGNPFICI